MKNTDVQLLEDAFCMAYGKTWNFDHSFKEKILLTNGDEILFEEAKCIEREQLQTGLGCGYQTSYSHFEKYPTLSFSTRVHVNNTTGYVDMTFVPNSMADISVKEVFYPLPLTADEENSYAVLNTMQGQLLPTRYEKEIAEKLPFDGQMCTESAYMPWFGEITPEGGYLLYVRQAWDAAYTIDHKANSVTRVFVRHLPSLGQMTYQRTVTICFTPKGSDYVSLCKLYRNLAEEEGKVFTLKEKAIKNYNVEKLIGCCVMHVDTKTHVSKDSAYYNTEEPEKNDRLTPFSHWVDRIETLKKEGVDKLYLHLDGWGQPGYDNQHPDYLPPCKEAGGYEGMLKLNQKMHELSYVFGIHDQYRDYYLDASTYDQDNAIRLANGEVFEMARWAGGKQNLLCASLAPDYLKRNFEELFAHGIKLDATYLDVFTCNEPDECSNIHHRMTRRECIDFHNQCFDYLTSKKIAPSSEEVNDWAIRSLVFCHWAPYFSSLAIPVPLFNLVYHDCVMIPWMMGKGTWGTPENTSGFLHALLNGGMGYLGERLEGEELQQNIQEVKVIGALQERVAMEQMVSHKFLNDEKTVQETVFSDGTTVQVDFKNETYKITYGKE